MPGVLVRGQSRPPDHWRQVQYLRGDLPDSTQFSLSPDNGAMPVEAIDRRGDRRLDRHDTAVRRLEWVLAAVSAGHGDCCDERWMPGFGATLTVIGFTQSGSVHPAGLSRSPAPPASTTHR